MQVSIGTLSANDISPIATLAACTRNSAETTPHPSGLKHGQIVEGGIANLNIEIQFLRKIKI